MHIIFHIYWHILHIGSITYCAYSAYLLPEMSRAELARRAKKTNNSHSRALRRRGGAIERSSLAASWLHWKGKVCVLLLSAYILPAASRDAAQRAWGNPSCCYPQAKLKLMGGGVGHWNWRSWLGEEGEASGRLRSWGRARWTHEWRKALDGGWAAEMQRDKGWNQCREPRVTAT